MIRLLPLPILAFAFVLMIACDDGGGMTATSPDAATSDTGSSSPQDLEPDLGFTPSPMSPITGYADSEFQSEDVPIELNQGFLKLLAPGVVGFEGRTFTEPMYLLVLGDSPLGCEQNHDQVASTVRAAMYFDPNERLPAEGIYPEVRAVDRDPDRSNAFAINSSSSGISGTLDAVTGATASGTVDSDGAARTFFMGSYEVLVCPE